MENLILANPNSGKLKGKENSIKLSNALINNNENVTVILTESEDDVTDYAKNSCGKYDKLFVLGGDGTISLAINAIIKEDNKPILGILPSGTVNNFAKLLEIPENIDNAINQILQNRVEKVDIGRLNENYFMSTITTGIIPEKVMKASDEDKENFGKLAFLSDLPSLISLEESDKFELEFDGEKIQENLSLILITTGSSVYSIDTIIEDASIQDGHLDFLALKETTGLEKISQIPEVLSDKPHYSDNVIRRRFKKAKIKNLSNSDRDILIDGDPGSYWPIEIEVLPSALDVLVGENFIK